MSIDEEKHREIRAAEFSIERLPDEGVTLTIRAGKLRLRFYIDGQWSDLVRQIHAGEGQLDDMVPFRMKPLRVSDLKIDEVESGADEEPVLSTRSIDAHVIPGLSQEDPVFETPLWKGAFPSLQVESDDADSDQTS